MTKQDQEFVDVLTGKLKLKLTAKPTETSRYVDKLLARNRADRNRMTETQKRAAIVRGC
jgi:hypothetical protein